MPTTEQILTDIARIHLGLETLETRNSDSLDFHDCSAESIRRALVAAFEAGRDSKGMTKVDGGYDSTIANVL